MAAVRMRKSYRKGSQQELTLAKNVELINCKGREGKSNQQLSDVYKIEKTTV
jgi:hypothetical protein